ncbi:MAG: ABC-2 family transporter protein, partial [Planctomycetia bacterium]
MSLQGEMAFRGNFLLKVLVELIWLGILLLFFKTIFSKSSSVASWSEYEYLFFVGAYYALEGFVETFFLENCVEFSELVRSGNLDFFLLKTIDPQFYLTLRKVDWSTVPKIFLGAGMVWLAMI